MERFYYQLTDGHRFEKDDDEEGEGYIWVEGNSRYEVFDRKHSSSRSIAICNDQAYAGMIVAALNSFKPTRKN